MVVGSLKRRKTISPLARRRGKTRSLRVLRLLLGRHRRKDHRVTEKESLNCLRRCRGGPKQKRTPEGVSDRQRDTIVFRLLENGFDRTIRILCEAIPIVGIGIAARSDRRRIPMSARVDRDNAEPFGERSRDLTEGRRAESIGMVEQDKLARASPIQHGNFDAWIGPMNAVPRRVRDQRKCGRVGLLPIHSRHIPTADPATQLSLLLPRAPTYRFFLDPNSGHAILARTPYAALL